MNDHSIWLFSYNLEMQTVMSEQARRTKAEAAQGSKQRGKKKPKKPQKSLQT